MAQTTAKSEISPLPDEEPSSTVTIVIVGGSQADRSKLADLLGQDPLSVVGQVDDADEAVVQVAALRPSVCLVAGKVSGGSLGLISRIAAASPATRIAVVTEVVTEERALRALRAGAHGYLSLAADSDRAAAAVQALADGEAVVPRQLTTRIVDELQSTSPAPRTRRVEPEPAAGPRGSRLVYGLLYAPRFMRHFWHRFGGEMSLRSSWRSTRARMRDYR